MNIYYSQEQNIVLDFFYELLMKKFYVKQLIAVVPFVVVVISHLELMLESPE